MRLIALISLFCAIGLSTQYRAANKDWAREAYQIRRLAGTDPNVVIIGAPTPAPPTPLPAPTLAPLPSPAPAPAKKKICFVQEDEPQYVPKPGYGPHPHPSPLPAPYNPLPTPYVPQPVPYVPPKPVDPLEEALSKIFTTPTTKAKLFDILEVVPAHIKKIVLNALPTKVLGRNPLVSIETWRKLLTEAKAKSYEPEFPHHHHHNKPYLPTPPISLPPYLPEVILPPPALPTPYVPEIALPVPALPAVPEYIPPLGPLPSFGGPSFGSSYGPSFGSSNGPSFGSSYGPSFGSSNGPSFGSSYGPSFGSNNGPSFGSSYGSSYGVNSLSANKRSKTFKRL